MPLLLDGGKDDDSSDEHHGEILLLHAEARTDTAIVEAQAVRTEKSVGTRPIVAGRTDTILVFEQIFKGIPSS